MSFRDRRGVKFIVPHKVTIVDDAQLRGRRLEAFVVYVLRGQRRGAMLKRAHGMSLCSAFERASQ